MQPPTVLPTETPLRVTMPAGSALAEPMVGRAATRALDMMTMLPNATMQTLELDAYAPIRVGALEVEVGPKLGIGTQEH